MARIAVRLLVSDHTHRGRRCVRGEVIRLHEWQVQWLGARVQRVFSAEVPSREPQNVAVPPAPERDGDESGGDGSPDDPDPEPEPEYGAHFSVDAERPAGGAVKHRQQGALPLDAHDTALTLQPLPIEARP